MTASFEWLRIKKIFLDVIKVGKKTYHRAFFSAWWVLQGCLHYNSVNPLFPNLRVVLPITISISQHLSWSYNQYFLPFSFLAWLNQWHPNDNILKSCIIPSVKQLLSSNAILKLFGTASWLQLLSGFPLLSVLLPFNSIL